MKKYKLIIVDADDTLLDYRLDEKDAFQALFEENGIAYTDKMLEECHAISKAVWAEAGLNDVNLASIRVVWHELYRTHVTKLFQRVFDKFSIKGFNEAYFAARFLVLLQRSGHLLPTVEETLEKLKAAGYKLAVLTNGISCIQRGRLAHIAKYFDRIFVSEEQGLMKPEKELFERIVKEFSVIKAECLMIGDSPKSDIAGALAAGVDACFVNGGGAVCDGFDSKYSVKEFKEILLFL